MTHPALAIVDKAPNAISPARLAARWDISDREIRRQIAAGKIPALDCLGPKRIPMSFVLAKEDEWRGKGFGSFGTGEGGTPPSKPSEGSSGSRFEPVIVR